MITKKIIAIAVGAGIGLGINLLLRCTSASGVG